MLRSALLLLFDFTAQMPCFGHESEYAAPSGSLLRLVSLRGVLYHNLTVCAFLAKVSLLADLWAAGLGPLLGWGMAKTSGARALAKSTQQIQSNEHCRNP